MATLILTKKNSFVYAQRINHSVFPATSVKPVKQEFIVIKPVNLDTLVSRLGQVKPDYKPVPAIKQNDLQ
ncbi:hypothetical protein Lspi_0034 [Legionella spiritensis]|uniref:Uncharacterized protein n=1 Tax=Legionella spiritensis TaxID=452 RepID=A0A0W0ZB39_LEGSP|nr:hypothetical protein Lspi_0034 [Legionella spiritensis]SNV48421.1 Uncharacterised protein [Legionella spiritensis]VEG91482.1 Uncharacterised protein [Legionella spiritensis]